ncbi:MAG: nitric oxide reductase activation protein [Methylococcales bacterium]|jgi:nitric oxide reductase NorD protein|nr:nitric oxide reductase activation protein [Methylococcales bacterium]MBT7408515.1 nitric oxide reductase activation protein [Methylococcales bacterium]
MNEIYPIEENELENRLDIPLEPILSSRRTASGPAHKLSFFDRPQQEFILRWVNITAKTNAEMAYQFAAFASDALLSMDEETIEAWLIQAMDLYDKKGLMQGISALRQVNQYAKQTDQKRKGLPFEDVEMVLSRFVCGLNGRPLKLQSHETDFYTDTETIFLPALISVFEDKAQNFQLYKTILVHLWAQTWYGTWRQELFDEVKKYTDTKHCLQWINILETIRLDTQIKQELPGVYRHIINFRQMSGLEVSQLPNQKDLAQLLKPTVLQTVLDILPKFYPLALPECCCYQSAQWYPDQIEKVFLQRVQKEKALFRIELTSLKKEIEDSNEELGIVASSKDDHFDFNFDTNDADFNMQLMLDAQVLPVSPDVRSLATSIFQDLGEIPPDYLVPAGDGEYSMEPVVRDPKQVWQGTYHEEGAFLYDEWDYERQHYRKNWCVLRELEIKADNLEFYQETINKYKGYVKSLHRTFETLRGEDKLLKRQPIGDNIDLDALVEAYGDMESGMEMSQNVFTKMFRVERNLAVMFMVDMSGSTKGWINEAEREALILLCEALEKLGDQYAIYGFSGMTRKRCEIYKIKHFDEPYNEAIKARISGIEPKDYTRMGVAIRHLSELLVQTEAQTRLLMTLSDGKPDDYDSYRGQQGIEDTRKALFEAKSQGIHSFCITIDEEARDYLPHMYGGANYILLDDVRDLPVKLSDIYRKLTS